MAKRPRSNLSRIVALLSAFDAQNTPMHTQDLLKRTEIGRATAYALIRALVSKGFLERADHGLLRLGPRAADLIYSPVEPELALTAISTVALGPGQIPSPSDGDAFEPEWRADLVERVQTSQFYKPGRVSIGFANASLSNPWRESLLASMRYAVQLNSDRISEFTTRTADDDPEKQILQINQLVEAGVDLLIVSCPNVNHSGLNNRILEVAKNRVPVVALDRRPSDPSGLVSFVTASDTRIGRITARWMVEQLGMSGRIWLLSGVEGASPAIRRQAAALAVFSRAANIVVEAVAYTDWTRDGGYAAIDRLLDQAGRPPEGVWCDSGLQGVGSVERFLEFGQELPIHTGGDVNQMYKAALHNKLPFVAVDYPAAMGGRAIEVALDILSGKAVRRRVELAAPVVLPRGGETRSVRADAWAETFVRWDLPDDAILSQGPSLRDVELRLHQLRSQAQPNATGRL